MLFGILLGKSFASLPDTLRGVHDDRPSKRLHGYCMVTRGQSRIANAVASLASLPPAGSEIPLSVKIEISENFETWTRDFAGRKMKSRLRYDNGRLSEQLGLMKLLFNLRGDCDCIEWRVAGVRCCGMPLPIRWFAGTGAVERCTNGRYEFDVRAMLPIVGLLVCYQGWLVEDE